MSKEINESHIYLFLANYGENWQKDADKMDVEDDQVSLYEFKKFLGRNWNGWEGVSVENIKADVIRNFFEKIDQPTTNRADLNRLDKDELASMEGALEAYKTLNDFITDKYNNDYPSYLDSKYGNKWKWDLTDPLTLAVNKCIEDGTTDEATVKAALESTYPEAYKNATAQCYVAQYTDSTEIKNLIQGLGYTFNDDNLFQSLILSKIGEIDNIEPGNIKSAMEQLVKDYLATAGLASGGKAENINYDKSKLNDIQKAKFAQLSGDVLNGKLNQIKIKDRDGNEINLSDPKYADAFNSAKTAFTDWYSKNATRIVSPAPKEALFDALVKDMQSNWEARFEESGAKKVFETEAQMIDSYVILQDGKSFTETLEEALPEDKYNDMLNDFKNGNTSNLESSYPEYFKEYNRILESIKNGNSEFIKNGMIDFNAIDKALLNAIKTDLNIPSISTTPQVSDTKGDEPVAESGYKSMPNSEIISYISNSDFSSAEGKNGKYSDGDGGLRIWGGYDDSNDVSLKDSDMSFAELYSGDYNIELCTSSNDSGKNSTTNVSRVESRLKNLGGIVVSHLAQVFGNDEKTKLNKAMNSVVATWVTALDENDKSQAQNNGASKGCNKADQRKHSSGTYRKLSSSTTNSTGITHAIDQKGNDQGVWMVNFRAFVDAILDKYKSMP